MIDFENLFNKIEQEFNIAEIYKYTDLLTDNIILQIYLENEKVIGLIINPLQSINIEEIIREIRDKLV